ncbi:MAG: thiamine pyrophosphate-dependent enzyme [Candidatus Peribacteraceae bacterium]|jgi:2-oxoglutarate ferredoxin oxidoreductase subunit beta|nr:thiamine pyrophosphate-dependent enzyme [Candidatus Peribacteraceae bacterium]MDP7454548.1 thiamine pyrophosphate-dependent enzyme [Candidatus Peribacteraceae bacterium]MDP7646391.1 thiamine pyrophosphate-dependent enzyme [Candidatus Peribacteraceae bacterium]
MTNSKKSAGISMKDYNCKNQCTWCDGCGNYGILTAIKRALIELGLAPHQVLICFDVGCHGNMSDTLVGYRFHGLHGRVISLSAGAALANPDVPVIAFGGDGACFSEGVGHLVHAIRSNYNMTFILHNNGNYGLTTGQASSLTPRGEKMDMAPLGTVEEPLNSMDFVFSLNPSFVARGFNGNISQLTNILKSAIYHQGFSYVDVLQACPTYNKFVSHEYLLEKCYECEPMNFETARKAAVDTSEKIATGVLYQDKTRPTFLDQLEARKGIDSRLVDEVKKVDVSALLAKFS